MSRLKSFTPSPKFVSKMVKINLGVSWSPSPLASFVGVRVGPLKRQSEIQTKDTYKSCRRNLMQLFFRKLMVGWIQKGRKGKLCPALISWNKRTPWSLGYHMFTEKIDLGKGISINKSERKFLDINLNFYTFKYGESSSFVGNKQINLSI